jgi:hypothetical protein
MPNVNLAPCQHGKPVSMTRTENGEGHWTIWNDCCESAIDWNWSRLARGWNKERKLMSKKTAGGTTP